MLNTPLVQRRVGAQVLCVCGRRSYAAPGGGCRRRNNSPWRSDDRKDEDRGDVHEEGWAELPGDQGNSMPARPPSLMEKLFPEEAKRQQQEATRRPALEVPRLPLVDEYTAPSVQPRTRREKQPPLEWTRSRASWELERKIGRDDGETTVLLLRAASLNLTEEDFRRLLPRGQHMEGWQLEQDHLLRVIPGRDMETLEPLSFYYVLFSSRLSAFTYQGHVIRLHRLVQQQTPSSITSALPPPPGLTVGGMDAHEAIRIFSLIPASQTLEFRLLRPPLSPFVQDLAFHRGYSALTQRPDRMPFEVRFTMEGPQLPLHDLRAILLRSARTRGLSWSGDEQPLPVISKWEPVETPSPMDHDSREVRRFTRNLAQGPSDPLAASTLESPDFRRVLSSELRAESSTAESQQIGRTPREVYIIGFPIEAAAQTFLRYWHRRYLEQSTDSTNPGWLAPMANVSMLW